MNNPFHKIAGRVFPLGLKPGMNDWDIRRIRILNVFYFVTTLTFFVATLETYLLEGVEQGNLVLVLGLVFQIGLIPLVLRKTNLAEFYFLFTANVTLFVIDNFYGPEAGTYVFYFPFILIIAFLVDFKKPVLATVHVLITCGFVIAGLLLRYKFIYRKLPDEIILSSYNFNLIISIFSMAVLTGIIVRMSYNQFNLFHLRIKERKDAEELMKASIREKETLLAEVHHRVKNNLAVISSLLNLQMNMVNNDYTRDVLRESRNRVSSMALIHQKLYQHANVEQIDFGSYAAELVQEIRKSYPDSTMDNISVQLDVEHIPLSLTKAVPTGLLLNELLSNCYKHAFQGKKNGKIFIRFKKIGKQCELQVEDNGVGLSGDFNFEIQESLGMTIIQSLVEQIDGKINISGNTGSGTLVKIGFTG